METGRRSTKSRMSQNFVKGFRGVPGNGTEAEDGMIHKSWMSQKFVKGFRGVPKNGSLRWRKRRCGGREEIHKVLDVPKICQGLPRGPWKWDRGGGWDDPQVLDVPKMGLPRGSLIMGP